MNQAWMTNNEILFDNQIVGIRPDGFSTQLWDSIAEQVNHAITGNALDFASPGEFQKLQDDSESEMSKLDDEICELRDYICELEAEISDIS